MPAPTAAGRAKGWLSPPPEQNPILHTSHALVRGGLQQCLCNPYPTHAVQIFQSHQKIESFLLTPSYSSPLLPLSLSAHPHVKIKWDLTGPQVGYTQVFPIFPQWTWMENIWKWNSGWNHTALLQHMESISNSTLIMSWSVRKCSPYTKAITNSVASLRVSSSYDP